MHVEHEGMRREEEMPFRMHSHWGGVLVGLFLIVIGLMFLFKQFLPILGEVFWPLVLIFVGAAILLSGLTRYSRH
jgi:hypothetical protein